MRLLRRGCGCIALVAVLVLVGPSGRATTHAASRLAAVGARVKMPLRDIGAVVAAAPGRRDSAIAHLRGDSAVRYAEPNFRVQAGDARVVPNDAGFQSLWGFDNFGQTVNFVPGTPDADIDAPEAWTVTTGSPEVSVGVVDTGIDYTHPDLAANIWLNPGENCPGCRNDGIDNDGNGYVDDWRGWDFVNNDNDAMDDNGHGTHVGGTIGAVGNNAIGVAGVNWQVKLMPLKFLGADGSGTTADAIRAVLYAADEGAVATNNSYGGDGPPPGV